MWGAKPKPEDFVGDYTVSKQTVAVRRYGPLIEGPQIMIENERCALQETEDHLKEKREFYKKHRVLLDDAWRSIAKQGEELKKNVASFNQFVIGNNEKRKRAQENFELHKKFIQEKEEGIQKYTEKIKTVQEVLEELTAQIDAHKIYEKYLNSILEIVARDEGFRNVDSFVERYEYYVELSLDFAKKQANVFNVLQNAKSDLAKYEEMQRNQIMGLHTQAASLQGRFEETSRRTRRMEILISRIKDKAHENYVDAKTAKVAIRNLYRLMCKKKNIVPSMRSEDFQNQLGFIGRTLKQYEKLNSDLQELTQQKKKVKKI